MGQYTLNYTGAQINEKLSTIDSQNALIFGGRYPVTLNDCNLNAVSACEGFYELWGPFVYVYVGIKVSPAIAANTATTIFLEGTFPTPECNNPDTENQGFAPLSELRGTYPYVRYNGSLYISGSSASVANNVIIYINGFYRRLIT